jgi:hypothetical protein
MDPVDFDAYADFEDQRESDFPLTRIQTALVWRRLDRLVSGTRLKNPRCGRWNGAVLPAARAAES